MHCPLTTALLAGCFVHAELHGHPVQDPGAARYFMFLFLCLLVSPSACSLRLHAVDNAAAAIGHMDLPDQSSLHGAVPCAGASVVSELLQDGACPADLCFTAFMFAAVAMLVKCPAAGGSGLWQPGHCQRCGHDDYACLPADGMAPSLMDARDAHAGCWSTSALRGGACRAAMWSPSSLSTTGWSG